MNEEVGAVNCAFSGSDSRRHGLDLGIQEDFSLIPAWLSGRGSQALPGLQTRTNLPSLLDDDAGAGPPKCPCSSV